MALLAIMLLAPIGVQSIRVRNSLRPPKSDEEMLASLRQLKGVAYSVLLILVLVPILFSLLIFGARHGGTRVELIGIYIAYGMLGGSTSALIIGLLNKAKIDRFLKKLLAASQD